MPRVVDAVAGERPADVVRQVVVADRDGVGVTVRALGDLRGGPDADPGHGAQRRLHRRPAAEGEGALERVGARGRRR